jgi:integrase
MNSAIWTITDGSVAKVKLAPGKLDIIRFDDRFPGFGVRVRRLDSGVIAQSFIYQYKLGGQHRRIRLGRVGEISAKAARELAKGHAEKVRARVDPVAEKEEEEKKRVARANPHTLDSVAAKYLEEIATTHRANTLISSTHCLKGWRKEFGDRALDAITPHEVATYLKAIRGPAAANRAAISLSALYTWARQPPYLCTTNPTLNIVKRKQNDPRDRVLSDRELVALWRATDGDQDYDRVVRLLLLTGCRRNEITHMKWGEIDLESGFFQLPKERSKNHGTHVVPLVDEAKAILRVQPRTGDHVFGAGERGLTSCSTPKEALNEKLSFNEVWQLRDLRRTVRSGLSRLGVAPHVAEAVLNHVPPKLIRTYDRYSYINEKREALERWAAHLKSLVAARGE